MLILLVFPFLPLAACLIVSAPEACGGMHVVTHATAFFGPRPATSSVRDVLLFAPRAQADGVYIRVPAASRRAARRDRPARRLLMGVLFGDNRSRRAPHPPLPPPQPPRAAAPPHAERPVARFQEDAAAAAQLEQRGPIEEEPAPPDGAQHDAAPDERLPGAELPAPPVHVQESDAPPDSPFSLFNACRQLSVPNDLLAIKGRVAVVARGVCDFAQKVGLMQDAGAVGVIVVNFKDKDEHLANMKLNETKENPIIDIPAVMIRYKDWATIAPCRNDTRVAFTQEGEASFDIDYGRDALNWAMMRGMALWILCQCGVNVVRYKRRVSEFRARADAIAALPVEVYERPTDHDEPVANTEESAVAETTVTNSVANKSVAGPAPSSPIMDHDPEAVSLIHSETESAAPSSSTAPPASSASTAVEEVEDSDEEEPVCAVCLEEFESGQQVRQLACSHLYHRTCIDPWLQSSSNCCPLCKREVPNLPPPPAQMHYGSMVV